MHSVPGDRQRGTLQTLINSRILGGYSLSLKFPLVEVFEQFTGEFLGFFEKTSKT